MRPPVQVRYPRPETTHFDSARMGMHVIRLWRKIARSNRVTPTNTCTIYYNSIFRDSSAVEQLTVNQRVVGSNPSPGAKQKTLAQASVF